MSGGLVLALGISVAARIAEGKRISGWSHLFRCDVISEPAGGIRPPVGKGGKCLYFPWKHEND